MKSTKGGADRHQKESDLLKTCINAWSVPGDVGFEEMFRDVKAAGFEGIELNVDRGGTHALTMDITDEALAEIKAISDKYALPVVSISTSLWGTSMADNPDMAKALLNAQLRCAKALGAGGILIVPSGHSDVVRLRVAREKCIATLKSLIPDIEAWGLKVGVENVWNGFFTSPWDMVSFIDEVGCPLVGAYYDLGNVLAFSRTEDWVDILGSKIQHLHIKGYKRSGGMNSRGEWVNISDASADWVKVKELLRGIGYDGTVTAETSKYDKEQSWADYYAMLVREISVITR